MRTPSFETSVGALASLLNGATALKVIDLYTVTLPSGTKFRWSGWDTAITVNGNTYALGPVFERDKTRFVVGVEVDKLSVRLAAPTTVTINSVPILQFISRGGFDGARLEVERAYSSVTSNVIVGLLQWFMGRIADVQVSRMGAKLTVSSDMELLDVQVPREVYQPGCRNTLYDASCGVVRATYTISKAAASVTNAFRNSFTADLGVVSPNPNSRFDMGTITFTSGLNSGLARTVKSSPVTSGNVHQLTVLNPWSFAVSVADTFTISAGCAKSLLDCATFANTGRFRAEPYIPAPETVI